MTTQVTVRLDDANMDFIDQLVTERKVRSRADAVNRALNRERRRLAAERDAEIYSRTEPDPDMQAIAEWASANPTILDD